MSLLLRTPQETPANSGVRSSVAYGEVPFFLSTNRWSRDLSVAYATLDRNLALLEIVPLPVCLPRNDSKSLLYFPSLFCPLAFTTFVSVLLHWQNINIPDGTNCQGSFLLFF